MTRLMPLWMLIGNLFLYGCSNESTSIPPQSIVASAASASGAAAPEAPETALAILSNPGHKRMNQTAPAEFDVQFHTSVGDFVVRVKRHWAPIGADRFYNLVVNGFYDETRFFVSHPVAARTASLCNGGSTVSHQSTPPGSKVQPRKSRTTR